MYINYVPNIVDMDAITWVQELGLLFLRACNFLMLRGWWCLPSKERSLQNLMRIMRAYSFEVPRIEYVYRNIDSFYRSRSYSG